ncbi:MAG: hypothetical protein MET45_16380 [Nostoc sp. LLA-1]|nr:hypothetical protein [Cyanocohniella sp. LLY]
MANCPNCGSNHIQLVRETNVNWGRAVAGWALFGVVGGAVGAVTGEDRNAISCLDCGTSWKASDLYKTLQVIENLTDITIDLTSKEDRLFLNKFIYEVNPYIEAISETQKKAEKLIQDSENKRVEIASQGCTFGCLLSIGGCTAFASIATGFSLLLLLLIPPLVGGLIGMLIDKANKNYIEQEIEKTRRKATQMKLNAEENFKFKIEELLDGFGY